MDERLAAVEQQVGQRPRVRRVVQASVELSALRPVGKLGWLRPMGFGQWTALSGEACIETDDTGFFIEKGTGQNQNGKQAASAAHLYGKTTILAFLDWIHRDVQGCDIYFLFNRKDRTETVNCTFRVAGKRPELWNAVTGERRDADTFVQRDGRNTLPLATSGPTV